MKVCPYCGQENPDNATVCLVDQTRLDPDVPEKSPRPKKLIDMAARPFTVTFAVQLLTVDSIFGLVQEIVRHQWYLHRFPNYHYSINFYLPIAVGCGIWMLSLYCIYRGKNWARWFVSCVIVLWAIVAPFMLIGDLHWDFFFHVLINGMAVIALFQRSSNEWYKGSKEAVSEAVPVT